MSASNTVESSPIDSILVGTNEKNEVASEVVNERESYEANDAFKADNNLARSLKQHHLQMITIIGVVGLGLFISSGGSLYAAGNVGVVVSYLFVGMVVAMNQAANIEITTFFTVTGGTIRQSSYFVDKSVGFALGWINFYSNIIPSELAATAVVMTYWSDLSPAIWISIFGVLIIALNLGPVKFWASVEVYFGIIKLIALAGLIILGIVIDAGGAPNKDKVGFRYWKESPWKIYIVEGGAGRLLAFWSSVSGVVYAFGGLQSLAVFGGEVINPRRSIFIAAKTVLFRILAIYMACIFVLSLIISSNDPSLTNESGSAAGSPFVLLIERAGIQVVPHIINAVILISSFSAANLTIMFLSRTLFALSSIGHAPKIFMKTKNQIPIWGVALLMIFTPLCYMSISESTATVFNWFQNISSGNMLLMWILISVNHLSMVRALKAQGYSRDDLPYKIKGGVYYSWISLILSILMFLTQGFSVFVKGHWDTGQFITTYAVIPIFFILAIGWKVIKRTKFVDPKKVDLQAIFDHIEKNPEPPIRRRKGWGHLKSLLS